MRRHSPLASVSALVALVAASLAARHHPHEERDELDPDADPYPKPPRTTAKSSSWAKYFGGYNTSQEQARRLRQQERRWAKAFLLKSARNP